MDDNDSGRIRASHLRDEYVVQNRSAGAILARGQRTVSAVLRVMGLSQEGNYATYHQALSRAVGSGLEVSAILLRLLLKILDKGWSIGVRDR